MAENIKAVPSVIVTKSGRLSDLGIKNGQVIFIQDKQRVALDWGDSRKFYNQIELLETDNDRQALQSPIEDGFYFVVGTAVLWNYHNGEWVSTTSAPQSIQFIDADNMPEIGAENKLYINKQEREISIWETDHYSVIANATEAVPIEMINSLFA